MKRVLLGLVVATIAITAGAQQPANTTSATATSTAPASTSKWSGGATFVMERAGRPADAYDKESPVYSQDATSVDSMLGLKAGYKLGSGSVSVDQRIFYSQFVNSDRQTPALLASARVAYATKLSDKAKIMARLSLPTTYENYQDNFLTALTVAPSYAIEFSPKWSLELSGVAVATAYGGPRREAGYMTRRGVSDTYAKAFEKATTAGPNGEVKTLEAATSEAQKAQDAAMTKAMNTPGNERGWYYTSVNAELSYNISDKLSLGQSVGYALNMGNLTAPKTVGQTLMIGTSLGYQATKQVNVNLGVGQMAALQSNSMDFTVGPLWDRSDVALYLPEQTTWSLTTAVTF